MMKALVGDSATPAVPGFDPEVSAQLYTTNGDITGDALKNFKTQSFTVELDGGTGDPVGGTRRAPTRVRPGGFVFQDSEADIQAEFEKNLPFAMDLASSATHPDDPTSHLGNTAPAFVPTKFATSNGNPQTVEVNAKRSLGAITAHWQVNGGPSQQTRDDASGRAASAATATRASTTTSCAAQSPARSRATGREGLVHGRRQDVDRRSRTARRGHRRGRAADGRRGLPRQQRLSAPGATRPVLPGHYTAALEDAGDRYDVYDVDAHGRTAPSRSACSRTTRP